MFSNTGALNVAVLNVFTLRALPSLNDIDVFSVVLTPISIALHRHHRQQQQQQQQHQLNKPNCTQFHNLS